MAERERRTAKRVSPPASPAQPQSPTQVRTGQREDDPLGRQVFFSQAPRATSRQPRRPSDREAAGGHGHIRAECSSCATTTRMTLLEAARAHFPIWAWVPVLHNSHWMRCPACSKRTWVRLTPILAQG